MALRNKELQHKQLPLGMVGVRLVKHKKKNRHAVELYAEAIHPLRGISSKRFYIGTDKTSTPERVQAGLQKALLFREKMVHEFKVEQLKIALPIPFENVIERLKSLSWQTLEQAMCAPQNLVDTTHV